MTSCHGSPDRSLSALAAAAGPALRVRHCERLSAVVEAMRSSPDAPGVLIDRDGETLGVLSRQGLERQLMRPFVRELFLERALAEIPERWWEPALCCPEDAPLAEVVDAALARPGSAVYEPLLVRRESGEALVDMRHALAAHNRLLAAATDELEQRRREAESALEARTSMIASLSHELRTPMTAILGYADLICEDESVRDSRDHASVIRRAGEHLLGLLDAVLDLSRLEAGRLELERIAFSPLELAEDVVRLFAVRAAERGVELRAEASFPFPAEVRSDPLRTRQILANLVSNALKFTEEGAVVVRARFDEREGAMEFEVADTGEGMSEAQLRRLFAPYAQAEVSTARRRGGSGLGLYLSRQLAERMGGTVSARSEPGVGSVFALRLPVEGCALLLRDAGEAAASRAAQGPASAERGLDARVLLAEDGPDNRRLIAAFLRRAGAVVHTVETGVGAVRAVREGEGPFDVFLLDLQMPEMDGISAARELRALGVGAPLIALTAHAMRGDRERCLAAGFDDYLSKPVDRATLVLRCAEWAERSRRRAA